MPPKNIFKNTKNFDQESWVQNQLLYAARESNVNELAPIPSRPSERRQSGPRILGAKPKTLKFLRKKNGKVIFKPLKFHSNWTVF